MQIVDRVTVEEVFVFFKQPAQAWWHTLRENPVA